jgi:hypothetical protein
MAIEKEHIKERIALHYPRAFSKGCFRPTVKSMTADLGNLVLDDVGEPGEVHV